MFYAPTVTGGSFNLQATLAASSSGLGDPLPGPHHPISCSSGLSFADDGAFACEHTRAPAGDHRTQSCLDHSIAILLLEVLQQREAS